MARRLLIVDDDAAIRTALSDALGADGFVVTTAENGARALARLEGDQPDVILSDIRMDDMDGLTLLRTVRRRVPNIDVVLMTAFDDMPTVVTAMRDGAVEFLTKPVKLSDVRSVLRRVFDDRRVRRKAANGQPAAALSLEGLVGRAPAMIAVYKLIGQIANTRASVLVRGESGTGKELVARAIHSNSAEADQPFVAVNCASLPPTLLESELFGHVRGAFTGAVQARRGCFAQAGRGTIFLDEIGDTSLEFQSKLLRVLQNREYQPVGAERVEHTEARVIAATHTDLEAMVDDRRFREDLYYRLRVVEVVIPPLRERREDIPVLVDHMLRKVAATLGTGMASIDETALAQLVQHAWPGNVRELEHTVMRAVVLAGGKVIHASHLAMSSPRPGTPSHVASLDEVERVQVQRALAATDGNKVQAADVLGISRPRLRRLIAKYGLESPDE